MSYRKVDWDGFKLGGSDRPAKVRFLLKEKPDKRDNAQEIRISNAIARQIKAQNANKQRFQELSAEQQAAILEFFK